MKRALLIVGIGFVVVVVMAVLIGIGYDDETDAAQHRMADTPCVRDRRTFLTAQSVPSAAYVPCLTDEAAGWSLYEEEYANDGSHLTLVTEKVQDVEWTITFRRTCEPATGDTVEKPGNPAEVRQQTVDVPGIDGIRRTEWMLVEGGCVVSSVTIPGRLDRQLILGETDELLALAPRSVLDDEVRANSDGRLSFDPPPGS